MSTNSRSLILIRLIGEKSKVIFHISDSNFRFFKLSSHWSNCGLLIGQIIALLLACDESEHRRTLDKKNDISIWAETFMLSN